MTRPDPSDPTPPYEQIRAGLAARIAAGDLVAGTRLPTVRAAAAEAGVAVNIVARAYRELEAAGLVETRGRAGTVVAAGGDRTRARVQEAAARYVAVAHELGTSDHDVRRYVEAALAAAKASSTGT